MLYWWKSVGSDRVTRCVTVSRHLDAWTDGRALVSQLDDMNCFDRKRKRRKDDMNCLNAWHLFMILFEDGGNITFHYYIFKNGRAKCT